MKRVVASVPQDVCIFCAIRIQKAPAKLSQRPQRRLFGTVRALRNPPIGAAVAVKKQESDDGEWAAWSPPPKIDEPRPPIRESTAQFAKSTTGTPIRRDLSQNPPPSSQYQENMQDSSGEIRPEAGRAPGQNYGLNLNLGQRQQNNREIGRIAPNVELGESESPWQNLRRKEPQLDRQEGNWIAQAQAKSNISNFRADGNVEQRRRLEASKQGEYVGLGSLHKRNRWSFREGKFQTASLSREPENKMDGSPLPNDQSRGASPEIFGRRREYPLFSGQKRLAGFSASESDNSNPNNEQIEHLRPIVGTPRSIGGASVQHVEAPLPPERRHDSTRRRSQSRTSQQEIVSPTRRLDRRSDDLRKPSNVERRNERNQGSGRRQSSVEDEYGDDEEFAEKRAARKRRIERVKARQAPTPIFLPEFIRVSNLAVVLKVRPAELLEKMEELGFEGVTHDHILDSETAGLVAAEYNFEPMVENTEEQDLKAQPHVEDKFDLPARPPVVTIMGHVDHGKTTLLDFLRKSSVAASEHGGITQHIGAFSVPMSGGRLVTFLDTPGHAAFLAMRQRGANVTDIVILVVAADDSVMPQTIEAIKHAQAAKVPVIVAVNKVDKEDARPEQVKQDLARQGVEIEDFGGDTQVVCVSGKTGQGMVELEDAVVALADILDMRAPTEGLVEGWVLESLSNKAGRTATILVRRGTLHAGDVIVAGKSWARVRSLRNEAGVVVQSAGPGTPVAVDGWRDQPAAGDEVLQTPDNNEQRAKGVIEHRLAASQQEQLAKDITVVNEARQIAHQRHLVEKAQKLAEKEAKRALRRSLVRGEFAASEEDEGEGDNVTATSIKGEDESAGSRQQDTFFILKADVSGSVEAVSNSITALGNSEIRAVVLRSGVGPITEFDVEHAAAAKGHIINFNTPVDSQMARLAEENGVQILDQSIIYRIIDQVKGLLVDKLPKSVTKRVVGEAEIVQVFDYKYRGRHTMPVAGCKVRNGEIGKKKKIRVMRGGEEIFDGSLASLKFVKKDINEARKGTECGMSFENWTEFKGGDLVQSYEEQFETRTL